MSLQRLSRLSKILNVFATSRDPSELLYYWIVWRNVTGLAFADELQLIYDNNNEIASLLGYQNAAEMWAADYATSNFEETIMKLWTEIKPLYDQLHAYVRRKLGIFYGSRLISENGTIPAHLLGNMWAQKWDIYDLVVPFNTHNFTNITTLLLQKKYTIQRMAKEADEFFQSMSFTKLNNKFWEKSILQRENRSMSCQASAWDLFTGRDFRLKMCLKVNGDDFVTLHHNLAHVHYFMEYKNQPIAFRDEPNPGFHEAIADLFTLTFFNSRHLKKLGLQKHSSTDNKTTINYLFQMALQKIVVLPYSIVLDLHRWNIFKKRYDVSKFNCEWWKLREELQGISPPVERGKNNYDPASKFHIIANKPYISYFVSTIQQFQLFKAVCIMADEYDQEKSRNSSKGLHNCDFSGNKEVGEVLKYTMSMGSSISWQRIMQMATDENKLSAKPLLEFFQPLMDYLQNENRKNKQYIGWIKSNNNNLCRESIVRP
ncbi:angiotensin-converting enzyme-like [Leptopilina boulardi]|uniref:angiotensin-converting enzyme-like n=1 Tax=Leptopilina boulardi TaxID=63433 RepID=UPI0021F594FE|nr:angiotensin-converting enzyme-like [Leptopilina boulardi]